MFLEQLYDLHRAIAIQKLLMQNCPEVQQVMGEAMRLMSSVGSQHGSGSGRGSKRQRTTPNGGATVPGSGSGDPSSFRPDSQFAAVPQLPGEAQTRDDEDDDGGSGDANGSGSAGANGSGGGSTSPQQLVPGLPPPPPLPYMYLAHTAVATPSGASAAPVGWQWGMPPLVQGQMGGMSLATAQAAAAAAAAFMQQAAQQPGGTGCTTAGPLGTAGTAGGTGTGGPAVTKWWHDPQLTFGPPVDTEMLARRPAGGPAALLASAREGPEVQSAPAGQLKRPADSRRRSSMPYSDGPRMRLKRKATADADEASSGTTGHTHDPDGGAGTTAGGPFKKHESLRARSARTSPQGPAAADDPMGGGGQDENAAQLLLAIGKQ
ncbi:hypothetical protein COHA_009599 [Chlorella ohadii]|uniref:Uncharacterized protein n=1 Tax=Chlorella ohadii TaxID=2649997 RepID=A0AAD5DLG2_9CHLO|nr:hypothetical protein COHA_009599 [Chlorella ohadii]